MRSETILLRQVHPDFIPGGQLTSQAFVPSEKDAGRCSVCDGDQITAEESYKHYTETLKRRSDSVWGVTCAEVSEVGLESAPDPLDEFPSHAVIDFTAHNKSKYRKLAKKLKAKALARGRLYPTQSG